MRAVYTLCASLLLTVTVFRTAYAVDCQTEIKRYKLGNGCTMVPDLRFTKPCNIHDICYQCGYRFGDSRLTCDKLFLRNMKKVCSSLGWWSRSFCNVAAYSFFSAVRVAGGLYYTKGTDSRCRMSWVNSCINKPLSRDDLRRLF